MPFHAQRYLKRSLFLTLIASLPAVSAFAASPLTQAITDLDQDTIQHRQITLRDVNIANALVFSGADARRELYLPVPVGVPLTDATLDFRASYLNADGGNNTMLLSLDGYPVQAQALNAKSGDANVRIGVDKDARPQGVVRLGVRWSSSVARTLCEREGDIGNLLRVDPASNLAYSFDARRLTSIDAAWNALSGTPAILVAPGTLAPASYDAAWRLGLVLQQAGKEIRTIAFPAPGDEVNLQNVQVPAALAAVPAFAALTGKDKHRIKDPAEIGALLMLGQTDAVQADLAIADKPLLDAIAAALNALQAQIQERDPEAAQAYAQWRSHRSELAAGTLGSDSIRLTLLGNRPVLMFDAATAAKSAGLLDNHWRKLARGRQLTVARAEVPADPDGRVSLNYLGGIPGTMDLKTQADWTATFAIGSVAYDGRVPTQAVVDVAASPGVSSTPPVASLYFNDYLIGARQLTANGARERIEARIPAYAINSRNVLRVSFQRQPVSDRCAETPQGFPAAVLPSSYIAVEKAELRDDFAGMAARFASGAQVLVPPAYLEHAATTLPRVIRISEATGISATQARFDVVADASAPIAPSRAFLAFDLPLKGGGEAIKADAQGRLQIDQKTRSLLDIHALDRMAVLQVAHTSGAADSKDGKGGKDESGELRGVTYRNLGAHEPVLAQRLLLGRGNAAMLDDTGAVTTFDPDDPRGGDMVTRAAPTGLEAWREPSWLWAIPIAVILVLFLVIASRRARRRQIEGGKQQ
ncbi:MULTISPECIES: cellulose biosynthesis cyclic di-GMP-binding regulatory protein BcsB [unclassified Achromobacter]|uniref:cellulose biosynthesis cyclic di-GMP-binding regulatory protein BcsB n=1 Tax=unclassified Achromobacter TaxID=2626865 RepID=UPI000B51611E|nr:MULTISPECIES: cellulose biosynthesis cyclic di-GMP-binding regulatory protein BcsB [unclassified Achromobacter]OWT73460.1 hypothetical protein CEY05_20280 [Achromobacter sp. HZ34]OWT79621.1 hypothetical protein CEY04_11700 [Achromobacter sp. HZ28]